jgi:alpha-amylase
VGHLLHTPALAPVRPPQCRGAESPGADPGTGTTRGVRVVPTTERTQPRPGRTRRTLIAGLVSGVVAVAGMLAVGVQDVASAPAAAATPPGGKDATAVLFQWNWNSVAKACTDSLAPAGYGFVQVSPPQETIQGSQWWTSYQPVSYKLEGKEGTRAQFASMVSTCNRVGVKVIADTVINHMSGLESGTGTAGTVFTHYNYPGYYQTQDFNDCRVAVSNYSDRYNVQYCNLVDLADLRTGSDYVRSTIAGYMNDLLSLGVSGFRIDAAKHIPAGDIAAIKGKLSNQSAYIVQEVIAGAGEPIQPTEYTYIGDVHEFNYGRNIKSVFNGGQLKNLSGFGESWGMLPSSQAGVFVDNHDTERNGSTLNYTNGSAYTLANVFMLAWPYGSPSIQSGYEFTSTDQGAPQSNGKVSDAVCYTNGWKCQHAWTQIADMVGFRNAASGQSVTNWWDNGNNQIAFSRGSKAFVAINKEGSALTKTFQTSLPAGTYCNVITGLPTSTGCAGTSVSVNASGQFSATVGANDAVAIHVNAVSGGSGTTAGVAFGVNATTVVGQGIFVVGDAAALGSWNTANAISLSPATYPIWRATVTSLGAGTSIQYKYIRKDAAGAVTWESGANRTATVPASGTLGLADTWRS